MDQRRDLIEMFHKTPVGRVVKGKESFRNTVGRVMHGLAHSHPNVMRVLGTTALIGGAVAGPVALVALSPVMFMGIYSCTPKKFEQSACEFLANVAVRKADALSRFINKQNISDELKKSTVQMYLLQNMPIGMANEYMTHHPNAVMQIMSGHVSEASYHNPEVYELEAVQEQFTKGNDKGGILQGMVHFFTKKYRNQVQLGKSIAQQRWQDRLTWEKISGEKPAWPNYMHTKEFERTTGKKSIWGTLTDSKLNHVTMARHMPTQKNIMNQSRPVNQSHNTVSIAQDIQDSR